MTTDDPAARVDEAETRDALAFRKRFPWLFSALTLLVPIVVLYLFARVLNTLIDARFVGDVIAPPLPPLSACVELAFKALSDLRGRLALSGPHGFLLVASLAAALFAWGTLARVLFDQHRGARGVLLMVAGGLLATAGGLTVLGVLGLHEQLMSRFPVRTFFAEILPNTLLGDGERGNVRPNAASQWVTEVIGRRSRYAAFLGLFGAVSLIACVAVLAYRFDRDGWNRPNALRRQIGSLLALFAVASILLVASNAAVRAFIEWPIGLVTAVSASDDQCRPPNSLSVREVELLRQAGQGLSAVWGAMCSAILIVTFAPAFVSIMNDVGLAARLAIPERANAAFKPDGSYDGKNESFSMRKAWRDGNGLTLTTSELVTAITAAAAPLLTSSAVDLGRTLLSLK